MTKIFVIDKGPGAKKVDGEITPNFMVSRTNAISEFISFFWGKTIVVKPKIVEGESVTYAKVLSYNNRWVIYITEDSKETLTNILLTRSKNRLWLDMEEKGRSFVRKSSEGKKINMTAHKISLVFPSPADEKENNEDIQEKAE